jgi:hypothetical protein
MPIILDPSAYENWLDPTVQGLGIGFRRLVQGMALKDLTHHFARCQLDEMFGPATHDLISR